MPAELNSVTLLSLRFATQMLPAPSIAMLSGPCNPPPLKPPAGEIGVPAEFSSAMVLLLRFAIQTLPAASISDALGSRATRPQRCRMRAKSACRWNSSQ